MGGIIMQNLPPNKRNKLLHRFYEPLVLLHVLETVQGDHVPRQRSCMSSPPEDIPRTELRRRTLDSLAYICDHEKGGDTMTAIFASTTPLTYHIACNKRVSASDKVVSFLRSILDQLGSIVESDAGLEQRILTQCVDFSKKRIQTYNRFLRYALNKCREISSGKQIVQWLQAAEESVVTAPESEVDLCRACFTLIKSPEFDVIKDVAVKAEDYGNGRNPYAELRHQIGRLGTHVQVVRVLLAAARRLPNLFEDFHVKVVNGPAAPALPPPPRSKLTLTGIANRMISSDDPKLKRKVEERLGTLNRNMDLERLVQKEYLDKGLKPRVHAELILLEYSHQRRDSLRFFDGDRYIGTSKPACYCCSLYFREHPGNFVHPATHQKIYLNWLPPTSCAQARDPNSPTATHERAMLNAMVKCIRNRAVEQVMLQTGGHGRGRQQHFDSVTWETFPNGGSLQSKGDSSVKLRGTGRHDAARGGGVDGGGGADFEAGQASLWSMPMNAAAQEDAPPNRPREEYALHESLDSQLSALIGRKLLMVNDLDEDEDEDDDIDDNDDNEDNDEDEDDDDYDDDDDDGGVLLPI